MLDCLAVVFVIVPAKHQVNAGDLFSKLEVVWHTHVCDSDDVGAAVNLAELLGKLSGDALIIQVDQVDFQILEEVDPLALRHPNKANLDLIFCDYSFSEAAADTFKTILGPVLLDQVGNEPLAGALGRHRCPQDLVHLFDTEVKVVVTDAGHVYVALVE